MLTRKDFEELEGKHLASYAIKSKESKGRKYKEEEHPYRSAFQRDRDRIIHSSAFRRLEYKTQVFLIHEGDYYRTRLTHTMEASQIARTLARALRLNEDLTEAVTLAHDLGHTPFGHSGEKALSELMQNHGGFEHNRQSLRVVDLLEERYPSFLGLNLTWEVRESIAKHSTTYDHTENNDEFDSKKSPLLEAQLSNIADEITYNAHDIDDGVTSGLLEFDSLKKVAIWNDLIKRVKYHSLDTDRIKYLTVRTLIDIQCTDLIETTEKNLKKFKIKKVEDVRNSTEPVMKFSDSFSKKIEELKDFLYKNLYRHYKVLRMEEKAKRMLDALFEIYTSRFDSLPPQVTKRFTKNSSKERIVCDYIAGMTDHSVLEEYKKLTDPFERV